MACRYPIKPLTADEIAALELGESVTVISGSGVYLTDSLYQCGDCDLRSPDPTDIEDGLCSRCRYEQTQNFKLTQDLRLY